MRPQKSRSRGKSRNNNNNNNRGANVVNRVFDSSGPEGKVRGTPQQIIEKYQQLHRDAQLSGDRVAAENFAQHSEHYSRLLSEAMKEQEARQKEQDERREAQEAQHRERQRERAEQHSSQQDNSRGGDQQDRAERDRAPKSDDAQTPRADTPRRRRAPELVDPGASDQPDVIDLKAESDADSGLVETAEAAPKPARKPRTRKPRVKPDEQAAPEVTPETPAAE